MNQLPKRGYLATTLAVVLVAACTQSPQLLGSPKLTEIARKTVDNRGAELDLDAGSKLEVPPNAVEQEVEIVIASAEDAPAPLEEGTSVASEILVLQPHGQAFAQPLTLTIAFDRDPTLPPQRYQVVRLSDENDETWELVENAFPNEDGTAVFTIETFSVVAVARRDSDCRRARCSDNPSYFSSRYHACTSNGRAAEYCNGWIGCAGPLSVDNEIVDLGGELCENLCSDNPCQNGTCTADGDGATCTCFGGYEGRLCDQQVDLCPGDVDKVAPGACGCGTPDNDSDADGVFDCSDGCPSDANKVDAGTCGCGVADTDSDGDGTFDCADDCPTDTDKIVAGVCGCGVADVDSDGDGAYDCSDACPHDPDKTFAGACGCGVADTDSDSDGTLDCQDGCPADAGKTAAGVCGCGVADIDSDSDGALDCQDECPADAGKTAAGVCGCGVADTDSDSDGTLDCQDECPADAGKTAAGVCGCGVADTDSDSDGTPDCQDECPADAGKTAAGVCGCGVADTDSDSDGTLDCQDECPADAGKTAAGVCGCGVADTDSDSDGTLDCQDECPADAGKAAAGVCGCGVADTDSDSDGTLDCLDGCPSDGSKTDPGLCGCGVAEGCNLPPVANPDSAVTKSSDPAIIDVLANDTDPNGDALTLVSVGAASPLGTALLGPTDRATFTPAAGFEGTATFDYVVSDGNGATATGTVTITVVPDVSADTDQDGIDDSSELVFGYDPNDADSDDDGIGDAAEDINMNGVVDEDETSAIDPDTDDNGLCDGARVDNDGDGVANPVDPCTGQQVIYVDPDATAGGDGTSWATALNSTVDIVGAAPGQEAWVAAATYRPSVANTSVLVLTDGLSVFGGFQGGAASGETSRAQRQPYVNLTILDGDLTGDGPTSDDACHVVIGASDARLSGVVVQHGNATCGSASGGDYGAGMLNRSLGPEMVDRVTFIHNHGVAGTVYNEGAEVTFIDVAFIGNRANDIGGGMDNTFAYPTMVNVAFVANTDGGAGWGGGYADAWYTEAVFDRVNFSRNLGSSGGGICTHDSSAVFNEVTFDQNGNAATQQGGGLVSAGSTLTMTNVTFTGNHADAAGGNAGAMMLADTTAELSNITVVNNTSSVGGGIYRDVTQVPVVSNSAFWNNTGGDLYNNAGSITFANTCSQDAISGTAMAQLAADPFVMPNASGEVYLNPAASDLSCFDLGDDATATNLGVDWSNQTTQQDGALDADSGDGVSVGNDVDAGRHYDPMAVTIPSFATDTSTISWTANNATQCLLTNDADWSLTPVAAGSGTLPHTYGTGTELFLICFGNAGEPAVTWAVVP